MLFELVVMLGNLLFHIAYAIRDFVKEIIEDNKK